MSELHDPATFEPAAKRRSAAERFANLGDRLATAVRAGAGGTGLRHGTGAGPFRAARLPELEEETGYAVDEEELTEWYDVVPRFPIARSGYDCAAVDEHIAMLERELSELDRELAELRSRAPAHDEVAAELERIGEETSSILLAAHDRARETTRQAQEQADRCIADAAAQALAITEDANRKKGQVEAETRRIEAERARLLADMEALAGTLSTVAREAASRFEPPAQPSAQPPAA